MTFRVWVVLFYYIIATILPIDKIIGRIYPVFGFALLFMAIGLILAFFIYQRSLQKMFSETVIAKKSIFKTDLTK